MSDARSHDGTPRLRPASARGRSADADVTAVEAFSRGAAIDRGWMGWGALRVLSRQDWAPGALRDEGRVANMERLLLVLDGALDAGFGDLGRHRVEAGGALWIGAGHGLAARLGNASTAAPLRLVELWLQPDRVNAPPAVATSVGDAGAQASAGWRVLAAGGGIAAAAAGRGDSGPVPGPVLDGDPALPLRQQAAVMAARLGPGAGLGIPAGGGRCWLEVLSGEAVAGDGQPLREGDGLGWHTDDASAPESVSASADGGAWLLLVALPA